ncbi:hypothetical protein J4Q44_G00168850 [Coregonus suidteri]|uniref:Uncharacterized protein n=1 Tax=Coregonus suidteri TaxID=861788 RepID=A0AAN8LN52_9TELE
MSPRRFPSLWWRLTTSSLQTLTDIQSAVSGWSSSPFRRQAEDQSRGAHSWSADPLPTPPIHHIHTHTVPFAASFGIMQAQIKLLLSSVFSSKKEKK